MKNTYELLSVLGSSNTTTVYKAREIEFNRLVALKIVQSTADVNANRHLWREGRCMAYCKHRGILLAYGVGELDGRSFLSMELAEGGTLTDRLISARPPRQAAEIAESVAQAVAHAHERGLIHRAISLSRIFICGDGTAKLGGFSLAAIGAEIGINAMREAIAADIHSLGVVLYELLTGRVLSDPKKKRCQDPF